MDRRTSLWVLVVFFGGSLLFASLRRLTDGEPTAVVVAAQLAGLAVLIAVVALLAKRLR